MSNVIPLNSEKRSELSFLMCHCDQENPEPFLVVVLNESSGPLIVGLQCPACERKHDVLSGFVQP